MARIPLAAFALAGLLPGDPRLIPGLTLALTARQQRELAELLRHDPSRDDALHFIQQALRRGDSIPRVIETLRQEQALQLQWLYAPPALKAALQQQQQSTAARPVVRPSPHAAPRPGR